MARNFARGEPPPSDSHEWVGLGSPPTPKQVADARRVEAMRAAQAPVVLSRTDTISVVEIRPKRRIWPWALATGIIGYVWGTKNRS